MSVHCSLNSGKWLRVDVAVTIVDWKTASTKGNQDDSERKTTIMTNTTEMLTGT